MMDRLVQAGTGQGRLVRIGAAALAILLVMASAQAGASAPQHAAGPAEGSPPPEGSALQGLDRDYLNAATEAQRTLALQNLARGIRQSLLAGEAAGQGAGLSEALWRAVALDVSGVVSVARKNALTHLLPNLTPPQEAAMVAPLLERLHQEQPPETRVFLCSLLRFLTRHAPLPVFEAVGKTDDERVLGDLAEVLRGHDLPKEIRHRFEAVGGSAVSADVRIQIALVLGPGSAVYEEAVKRLMADLAVAQSEASRQRLALSLSRFPEPRDAIAQAMIDTASRSDAPTRVLWRLVAESGQEGLLYLATRVLQEIDPTRRVDQAVMMAAVAVEKGPWPDSVARRIIDAAIHARLHSEDPLLRSAVQAWLLRAGLLAVEPVRAAREGAQPGQLRDDFDAVLKRLETR